MRVKFNAISKNLKDADRRLTTLDKHIEQAQYFLEFKDIYKKYQQQKPKHQEDFREAYRREITLYEAAERYLNKHMNSHSFSVKTLKEWKSEKTTLNVERSGFYREYTALREETQKVETIKRNVEQIIREESRETQPIRVVRGMEI